MRLDIGFISATLFVLVFTDETKDLQDAFNKKLYILGKNCRNGFVVMDSLLCIFCFCMRPGVMVCKNGNCHDAPEQSKSLKLSNCKGKKCKKGRDYRNEKEYKKLQEYYYDTYDCKNGKLMTLDNCLVCECKKGSLVDCTKFRPCASPMMKIIDKTTKR